MISRKEAAASEVATSGNRQPFDRFRLLIDGSAEKCMVNHAFLVQSRDYASAHRRIVLENHYPAGQPEVLVGFYYRTRVNRVLHKNSYCNTMDKSHGFLGSELLLFTVLGGLNLVPTLLT